MKPIAGPMGRLNIPLILERSIAAPKLTFRRETNKITDPVKTWSITRSFLVTITCKFSKELSVLFDGRTNSKNSFVVPRKFPVTDILPSQLFDVIIDDGISVLDIAISGLSVETKNLYVAEGIVLISGNKKQLFVIMGFNNLEQF